MRFKVAKLLLACAFWLGDLSFSTRFVIPSNFRVTIQSKEPPTVLDSLYVAMDVMQPIRELALKPWDSHFIIGRPAHSLYVFSEVGIAIRPYPGAVDRLRNYHALWLLYKCFLTMKTERHYRAALCLSYLVQGRAHVFEMGALEFMKKNQHVTEMLPLQSIKSREESKSSLPPSNTVPLDYSGWEDVSGNSTGENSRIKTLIGDFHEAVGMEGFFITLYQTIIDRASRISRTRIADTIFGCQIEGLKIDYHRRPDEGIEEMDYDTVVRGLSFLPIAVVRNRRCAECSFVVLRDGQPKIDGHLRKGTA
ncbi:MAG: hypothetical protein Q9190_000798 [Brigantiaea leucoxantha]